MPIAAVVVPVSPASVESLADNTAFIGPLVGVPPPPFEIMAKFIAGQRNHPDMASLINAFGINGFAAGSIPADDDLGSDRLVAATLRRGGQGKATGEKEEDEG